MRTKTELTLEQTQQSVSDEVLAETDSIHMLSETPKLLYGIEDSHHRPNDAVMRTSSAAAIPHQGDSLKFYLITGNPDGGSSCDEVLKLKNFKKDGYTSFQNQEKYEHVGPKVTSTQDGKRLQDDDKRLYLVDDLKKLKITYKSS
ncbi:hypothetical protein Tco_0896049 [Tanacetum coccineum]